MFIDILRSTKITQCIIVNYVFCLCSNFFPENIFPNVNTKLLVVIYVIPSKSIRIDFTLNL